MTTMRVEEYRDRMRQIGWKENRIEELIKLYKSFKKVDDGTINVLEGDFNKKNLRIWEYSE